MSADPQVDEQMTIEKFVSDFLVKMQEFSPDIGKVVVLFEDIKTNNIVGFGTITGPNDLRAAATMLESYSETLRNSIPSLH